ncbi:MAG: hypothetical protein E7627_06135 [Ruminococcaceae bacterium]|nr:hypothetical protein [Oscillospiraceae bacterium]
MIDRFIGLCMAAGGVKVGFDLILGEIRSGRAKFVIIASDASDRTKKQLTDKCKFYGIKYFHSEYSGVEIADMIGKRAVCAAAAFTGKGPYKSVLEHFEGTTLTEDRKDD